MASVFVARPTVIPYVVLGRANFAFFAPPSLAADTFTIANCAADNISPSSAICFILTKGLAIRESGPPVGTSSAVIIGIVPRRALRANGRRVVVPACALAANA